MRFITAVFFLFPLFGYPQKDLDSIIYSKYLQRFEEERKVKITFVINKDIDTLQKNTLVDIQSVVDDIRGFIAGDKSSVSWVYFYCKDLIPVLRKDTSWVSVIAKLKNREYCEHAIKNNFIQNLNVIRISEHQYRSYRNPNHIENNWKRFHLKYPMPSALTELSGIASDDKHAVFYFSSHCGGLCGIGQLVKFYKDDSEWKFLATWMLWQN